MREYITLYEGFLTYGGMSVREMEAIAVGLDETMDENMINQGPQFIQYMTDELIKKGVPVVTPAGGLGCHINAMEFVDHIPQERISCWSSCCCYLHRKWCSRNGTWNNVRGPR